MAQFTIEILPGRTGVITAEGALADVYRRDPAYSEVLDEPAVEDLHGKELDAELKRRGLPTTGKADDKRLRLLEASDTPPTGFEQPSIPDPGVLTDRDAVGATPTTRATQDRDADIKEN